ncbi:MAG: glutamate racemase [Acidobacteria bacterium 37-71-11]|nr:MAG: glutamate racemase [Acidobacteria bacterium 37-71-11]HQT95131.1 glutamate racemase [Thermoanaerobaculaceae bacterium]
MTDARPIAIFDSGIGGLTVLAALQRRLPGERFVYLGDTARLPYGTKSAETVVRYAVRAAGFLAGHDAKLLVVACNSVSASALPALEEAMEVPVIGVVAPGARTALAATRGRVGVIGTESTVASGAYERALRALRPDVEVTARACPLFVPLAEEGWWDHPVTREVAALYLEPFTGGRVDTLILGCTHYPLLRPAIAAALGDGVRLVDSAEAVAAEVEALVAHRDLGGKGGGGVRLLVTDAAARIDRIAGLILPGTAVHLELVDLPD